MGFFNVHGDPTMDPYTILKLPPTASDAEIKKAYRLQMLHLHPDKLSPTLSEESIAAVTEKFHNVKDAYEFLTNPMHLTSRRMYMAKMASRRAEYERREAYMRRNGMSGGAAAGGVHGYHSGGGGAAGMAGTGMPPPGYSGAAPGGRFPPRNNGNSYAVPKKKSRTRAEPGIPEEEEVRRDARGRRSSMDENRRYYRGSKDVNDAKRSKSRTDKRQNGYKSERDTAATGRKKSSSNRRQTSSGTDRRGRDKSSDRQRKERTRSEPRHRRDKYDSTDDERFADPKDHEKEKRKSTKRGKSTDRRRTKERTTSAEDRRKRARSAPARYHSKNKKSSSKNKSRDRRGEKEHPKEYYCPLTKRLMKDPVIDTEGNTYEREAIERWLRVQSSSPITNGYLSLDMIKPNRDLKKEIYKATGKPRSKSQARAKSRSGSPSRHDLVSGRVLIDSYLREISSNSKLSVSLDGMGICAFSYRRITFVIEVPVTAGAGFMVYSSFDGESDKYKLADKIVAWNTWLRNIGRSSSVSYVKAGQKTVFTLKGGERDMSRCDVFQKALEYFVEMSLKLHNLLHPGEEKVVENVCLTRAPVAVA